MISPLLLRYEVTHARDACIPKTSSETLHTLMPSEGSSIDFRLNASSALLRNFSITCSSVSGTSAFSPDFESSPFRTASASGAFFSARTVSAVGTW